MTATTTSAYFMPGYPCATCRRASGGYSIHRPDRVDQFCSEDCMKAHRPGLDHDERAAAVVGGDDGGAYLDSIGKFDLRTLSAAEWGEFCARIFAGACAELRRKADDEVPF